MSILHLQSVDISPRERGPRVIEALHRFTIREVTDSGPLFEMAYQALWDEFGARGELEVPEVLLRELTGRDNPHFSYHLLTFWEGDQLAAVRDLFVVLVPDVGGYVLLSHSLVIPRFRRSGVGALIRGAPVSIGRRQLQRAGISGDLLLMAEMDPLDPNTDATMIRLLAYGNAGFRVIPPQILPYVQPDFSGWVSAGREPAPIPLMLVVRWVDHEEETALPAPIIRLLTDGIDEVHHLDYPEDTKVRRANMAPFLEHRAVFPTLEIRRDQLQLLSPILRTNAMPLFSRRLGGTEGQPIGDSAVQLQGLIEKWGISPEEYVP